MNTFTFFALVICAIFAMVSAGPNPMAPAEMAVNGPAPEAIPVDDMFEGLESRGYGYNRRGGGGGRGHYGQNYGQGHDYGRGHNYGHGYYGRGR